MLIGIVGKPNSGKSTFFKAATMVSVEIGARPFVTIKPNRAVGFVKVKCVEKELNVKCNPHTGYCKSGNRFVPVELMDVAGLVPDAHKGEGMGSQFLSDLNQAKALVHVIDISGSTDSKGNVVETGSHDPLQDVEFLEKELDYWYFNILNRGWERLALSASHEKERVIQRNCKANVRCRSYRRACALSPSESWD